MASVTLSGIDGSTGKALNMNGARGRKYEDRYELDKDSLPYRYGIRQHLPSEGNERFMALVHGAKPGAPAYVTDRDGAQKMALSQPFFVQKITLGQARDRGAWIVGVGDDAGGFPVGSHFSALKAAAETGEEVPRRRWPHNAFRAEN